MIGNRIRIVRKSHKLTLLELSHKANIDPYILKQYEINTKTPDSSDLLKLSLALGVKVEYFFRPDSDIKWVHLPEYDTKIGLPSQNIVYDTKIGLPSQNIVYDTNRRNMNAIYNGLNSMWDEFSSKCTGWEEYSNDTFKD